MKAERAFYMVCAGMFFILLGIMVLNAVRNPMAASLDGVELAVGDRPENPGDGADSPSGFDKKIAAKKSLWRELVAAPPPPAPAPPPPPKKPDIKKILEGVRVSKAQVGQKAKVFHPGKPQGEFLAPGEIVNGCKITKITPTMIRFTYYWEQGKEEILYHMARE